MVLNNPSPQSDAVSSDLTIGVVQAVWLWTGYCGKFCSKAGDAAPWEASIAELGLKAFMAKVQRVWADSQLDL